jgi:dephospho-CoA kinase
MSSDANSITNRKRMTPSEKRFNELIADLRKQLKAEKLTSSLLRAEVFDAATRYSRLESRYRKLVEEGMKKAIKAPTGQISKQIKLGDMK